MAERVVQSKGPYSEDLFEATIQWTLSKDTYVLFPIYSR